MADKLQELKRLEALENNGQGVQCVKSIIRRLEANDAESASYIAINENDKIRCHPVVRALLRQMLPQYDEFLQQFFYHLCNEEEKGS